MYVTLTSKNSTIFMEGTKKKKGSLSDIKEEIELHKCTTKKEREKNLFRNVNGDPQKEFKGHAYRSSDASRTPRTVLDHHPFETFG